MNAACALNYCIAHLRDRRCVRCGELVRERATWWDDLADLPTDVAGSGCGECGLRIDETRQSDRLCPSCELELCPTR